MRQRRRQNVDNPELNQFRPVIDPCQFVLRTTPGNKVQIVKIATMAQVLISYNLPYYCIGKVKLWICYQQIILIMMSNNYPAIQNHCNVIRSLYKTLTLFLTNSELKHEQSTRFNHFQSLSNGKDALVHGHQNLTLCLFQLTCSPQKDQPYTHSVIVNHSNTHSNTATMAITTKYYIQMVTLSFL